MKLHKEEQEQEASEIDNNTNITKTTEQQLNISDNNIEKPSTKKKVKEIKLINRTSELLKAGCGGGILAESSSFTPEYNHNKICVGLYSGLSILKANIPGKESTVPYDLILHPGDMKELSKYNGSIGIVLIPPSQGALETVNSSLEGGEESIDETLTNMSKKAKNKTSVIKVKSEVHSFDVKVPREKWTHIAFVSSSIPNNRLTFYMVLYTSMNINFIYH